MVIVSNLKTLLEVIDRGRCVVCGDVANGSKILRIPYPDENNQSQKETFYFCCLAHEEFIKDLLKKWN